MENFRLGEISVDVVLKDIKNVHLSVYPPNGKVKIAAPKRMKIDTIRVYAISKLDWIKKQQKKFKSQKREAKRDYLTKESHYFLGKRYLLKIHEHNAPPKISLKHTTIEMYLRPDTTSDKRHKLMEEWYRDELQKLATSMLTKWEKKMKLSPKELVVRKMKTKWGTCNPKLKRICLNLELAKKPYHCIVYILVHEMVHLLERNHNDKFTTYMNHYLPEWKELRRELNKLPVGHREWEY